MSTTISSWSVASESQTLRFCAWQVDSGYVARFDVVFDDGNAVDKTWHEADDAGLQRRFRGFQGMLAIQGLHVPPRVLACVEGDPTTWAVATRPCLSAQPAGPDGA